MFTALGTRRKEDGDRLISALEQTGIEIYMAFWIFRTPINEWRLQIVSPDVQRMGPRAILSSISDRLERANGRASFDLFEIEVSGPQHPAVIHLITTLDLSPTAFDTYYEDIEIDGERLEGLHVYFVKTFQIFKHERLLS